MSEEGDTYVVPTALTLPPRRTAWDVLYQPPLWLLFFLLVVLGGLLTFFEIMTFEHWRWIGYVVAVWIWAWWSTIPRLPAGSKMYMLRPDLSSGKIHIREYESKMIERVDIAIRTFRTDRGSPVVLAQDYALLGRTIKVPVEFPDGKKFLHEVHTLGEMEFAGCIQVLPEAEKIASQLASENIALRKIAGMRLAAQLEGTMEYILLDDNEEYSFKAQHELVENYLKREVKKIGRTRAGGTSSTRPTEDNESHASDTPITSEE